MEWVQLGLLILVVLILLNIDANVARIEGRIK
jgi:hypothetical protein